MFPAIVQVKSGSKTYRYLRLLESFKKNGKSKHRVIGNLGRLDLLGDKLGGLLRKLRDYCDEKLAAPDEIHGEEVLCWGPVLVARQLWKDLELDKIIRRLCGKPKREFDVAEESFVIVANRLVEPGSEHGLARWLEHMYVCDEKGRRHEPQWIPAEEVSREQRVRVQWPQLNKWYRTLDALNEKKKEIEKEVYLRARDLFSGKADLVFYDVTSIYFERREPKGELRRHGYSRDGKPRDVQVLYGLVMVGGLPIAGHVFRGNETDGKTLKEVVEDIRGRFGIGEVTLVGDRGMMSVENVAYLETLEGWHYLLGHRGRTDGEAGEWLEKVDEKKWTNCGRGTQVQEVESGREGVRVFVAESEERREYEEAQRIRTMERAGKELKGIEEAVKKGRLEEAAKIGVRVGAAMKENKARRYYSYEIGAGRFEYHEDEEKMRREKRREGRYILTTNHPGLTAVEAVARYKELSEVESGFRNLKDVIEGRPVYHKRDERVKAHLFVAQLALMLLNRLRQRLEKAGVYLSAAGAMAASKAIGIAELKVCGEKHLVVSTPKGDAKRVLKALGIEDRYPAGVGLRGARLREGETVGRARASGREAEKGPKNQK